MGSMSVGTPWGSIPRALKTLSAMPMRTAQSRKERLGVETVSRVETVVPMTPMFEHVFR